MRCVSVSLRVCGQGCLSVSPHFGPQFGAFTTPIDANARVERGDSLLSRKISRRESARCAQDCTLGDHAAFVDLVLASRKDEFYAALFNRNLTEPTGGVLELAPVEFGQVVSADLSETV